MKIAVSIGVWVVNLFSGGSILRLTDLGNTTSYKLALGQKPRVGLSGLPLHKELIETIATEANLNKVLGLLDNGSIEDSFEIEHNVEACESQNDYEMTEQGTTEEIGDVGVCEMDDVHQEGDSKHTLTQSNATPNPNPNPKGTRCCDKINSLCLFVTSGALPAIVSIAVIFSRLCLFLTKSHTSIWVVVQHGNPLICCHVLRH
jgi:hypothetical protein